MSFLKKRNQAFLNYPKLCSLNIIGSGGLLQKLSSLVFFFFLLSPSPSLPLFGQVLHIPGCLETHSATKYEDGHELLIFLQQPHHLLKL